MALQTCAPNISAHVNVGTGVVWYWATGIRWENLFFFNNFSVTVGGGITIFGITLVIYMGLFEMLKCGIADMCTYHSDGWGNE